MLTDIYKTMAKRIYKAKEPVRLRLQQLKDGNKSLYLDYSVNGKRIREFLKLYLTPEHTTENKEHNKETLRLANAVKAQRVTELQNESLGFKVPGKGKILLSDYLRQESNKYIKRGSESFGNGVLYTLKIIEEYGDRPLNKIDKAYIEGFIEYLKNTPNKYGKQFTPNSQVRYLSVLTIALNTAVREGLLRENPAHRIESTAKPKAEQSKRVFFTIEDLRLLYKTPAIKRRGCTIEQYEEVKRAFFFACYTGLRFSDIFRLKWEDIKTLPNGVKQIEIIQKKTKGKVNIPLKEALNYLPVRSENTPKDSCIFNLRNDSFVWEILKDWGRRAGLEKNISFHIARHTFATTALAAGADVFTLRDLLGHKNINTTQIYAKVVAESKIKAVNLLPSIK